MHFLILERLLNEGSMLTGQLVSMWDTSYFSKSLLLLSCSNRNSGLEIGAPFKEVLSLC